MTRRVRTAAPGRTGGSRRSTALELVAVVAVALAAFLQFPTAGWNATSHYALVESLANGTPVIDDQLNQSGDISWFEGHFYSVKAPGLAFLSLPVYAAFDAAGATPAQPPAEKGAGPPGAHVVSGRALWQTNLIVVASLLVLLLLVRSMVDGVVPGWGTATAVLIGVSTMLLPYSASYFSHVVAAALGFGAFAILARTRTLAAAGAAGLLAGYAIVVEFPSAIVAAALAGYAVAQRCGARRVVAYAVGGAVGIVPLVLYNAWAFGSPLGNSYDHAVARLGVTGHDRLGLNSDGFLGLTYPHPERLADVLVSSRGLFTLTPVLALALGALPLLARRGARLEAWFIAALAAAFLLYNASYYLPLGGSGPGPRFLVPLIPFLALPLGVALQRLPVLTLTLAAVSAFWMVVATLTGPLLPEGKTPRHWLHLLRQGSFRPGLPGNDRLGALLFAAALAVAVGAAALATRRSLARAS